MMIKFNIGTQLKLAFVLLTLIATQGYLLRNVAGLKSHVKSPRKKVQKAFGKLCKYNSRAQSAAIWGHSDSNPEKIGATTARHIAKLGATAQALLLAGATTALSKSAFAADNISSGGAVVVLGSNGKTGKLILEKLAKAGQKVQPVYRSIPKAPLPDLGASLMAPVEADVTKIESLEAVIKGASAVIFAASASSKGGNAKEVDYLGVENVAKECVRLKVPRLVVISSGAITRPDSLGFKITNLFGGIMDYKLKGENALREAYKAAPGLQYVIVRPGGLLDGAAVGPGRVELNQGDTISGEINRSDVAECAAAAAISKSIPGSVTFEMYEGDKSGPLQSEFPKKSGFERSGAVLGADYNKLFEGLKLDG